MPIESIDRIFDKDMENIEFLETYSEEKTKLEAALAILKAREAAGLSQRDLAEKSGIPQSTIARIERGANTSIATMSKIASALNLKVKISLV